jgi:hypothetical protein
MTIAKADLQGLDCAWLATDDMDQIAVFTTAGEGPIPTAALASVESAEELIATLPETTQYELLVQLARPDDFIAFASRGFFAYDWFDIHRTNKESTNCYDLLAKPLRPITLSELPVSLQELASATRISGVTFGQQSLPISQIGF